MGRRDSARLAAGRFDPYLPHRMSSITPSAADIRENLARLRDRIVEACGRANRAPGSVSLVAVSKFHPAEAVEAALDAGQTVFGENRVQEAATKFPALRPSHPALRLRIIGALQTNKARDAVRLADAIESLDRPRLAAALADAMEKENRRPELLVQVNTGDEPQKAGVPRAEADAFVRMCRDEHGLAVAGLMCIPPFEDDPRPHFGHLSELASRHGLPVLSMGMSGDFEAAIACGATHVRLGTAIFGARPAPGPG